MNVWPYDFPAALSGELDDAGLPAEDFRVLLHVCRRCGDGKNGRACDSNVSTMARVCRLHADTVRKILKRLCELGWLSATERSGRTTVYTARFVQTRQPIPLSTPPLKLERLLLEGVPPFSLKGVDPYGLNGAKGIPTREPKKGTPIESLPFPSELFKSVWNDWKQHRSEKRKPVTPLSAKKSLLKLSGMGEGRAIAAINHSIENGYQGIFEPSAPATTGATPRNRELSAAQATI